MSKVVLCLSIGLALLTSHAQAASPIIISEFMANNGTSISDDFGDRSDWIEIYNRGTGTVNLAGWFLTDLTNNLTKWQFPATNLVANGYLLVFASNRDRRDARLPLHTNFRLTDDGEYLALVEPDGTTIATEFRPSFGRQAQNVSYGYASDARNVTFIGSNHMARALVPSSDIGLAWTEPQYSDAAWLGGTTGVGYDNNTSGTDYNPLIGLNVGAMFNVNQSVYIRVPFVVTNVAEIDTLTLRMQYDDGYLAYINGANVMASDNSASPPLWNSGAPANRADGTAITWTDFDVSSKRDFLQVGTNILAIQGQNNGVGSSDLLVVPQLLARTRPSGVLALRYFPAPTPGAANNEGVAILGPIVSDVQHTPRVPTDNDDLVVTARVTPAFSPLSQIRLRYRVMFSNEVELEMFDDGTHGDTTPGDGVFGATIPATAANPGEMIRWYVRATDTSNIVTRLPLFTEPLRSPEYFGTMVFVAQTNNLPILHWFVANPAAAATAAGTRASLFFLDEFYDNVGINLHGQSSSGFPKKSYDIDFHRGYNFRWKEGEKRVDDLNLLTTYPDKAHVRNILAYEIFRDAGTPYHFVQSVRVHQNGVFFSEAHMVENGDADYLDRLGMDTEGALYKMYNTLNVAQGEKKTRKYEDTSDLQALINGALLPAGGQRNAYLFDNIDVPECINYLAAQALTGNVDCCHKNYYLYRDTRGNGEWQLLPWDIDLSFGRVWSSPTTYWDDVLYPNTGLQVGNNNTLITAIYGTPELRAMYFRRIRTLMEQLLQPPGTPASQGKMEKRADELLGQIGPDAALDLAKWGTWCCSSPGPNGGNPPGFFSNNIPVASSFQTMSQAIAQLKDQYLPARRTFLFSNQIITAGGEIPLTQPSNSFLVLTSIEYSPASSNQAQEYVEFRNTNSYALDISGWRISGGIEFTFAPGTVVPANGFIYISPDVRSFRARTSGPRGGQGLFIQGNYSGQLSARGETLRLEDNTGRLLALTNFPGTPSLPQQYLRITELMYHPSPLSGNTNDANEFEYVELKNIGTVALNLNGVRFTNGIIFSFSGSAVTNLAAGESVLVVKNAAQIVARYGASLSIAGQYTGSLDNSGERIQLLDAVGEEILDFSYNNSWYPITDGLGFSLEVVSESAPPDNWNNKSHWRPSGFVLGSPGQNNPTPPLIRAVLVNEVLSRTTGVPDSIELWNPGSVAVDISGWFLTDDFTTPQKFRIPDGTVVNPGDYRVFTESNFNANPGVPPNFALSSDGDEAYLFSALANGDLTGFYHGFDFGAAEEGVSFGLHVSSDDKEHFVAQIAVTLGATNAGPRVGPVVISEIMYHPIDSGTSDNTLDEFIELRNTTTGSVELFNPTIPVNTWRITGGVDFDFPTNVTLAPGEAVLLVNFTLTNTPLLTAFRGKFNVSTNVRLFGPYSGALNNDADEINVRKPILPSAGTNIPYVLIEKVEYQDALPWAKAADGLGLSLQRWNSGTFANDPANWVAANATAGTATVTNGASPQVTAQPASQLLLVGQNATISVSVTGTPPFSYQWRHNGTNVTGATNLALQLTNVQPHHAGEYELIVGNSVAFVFSEIATITVQYPVVFVTQPQTIDVRIAPDPAAAPTTNVTFASLAVSASPISYQWRRNGLDIPGATNVTLTIVNVQTNDLGYYSVRVEDALSFAESTNAWLYPLIDPNFIEQPIAQTAVVGGRVTLSAAITGWPPPFTWTWLRVIAPQTTNIHDLPVDFYSFTAATNASTVNYRAIVRNRAFPSGRSSVNTPITTLADTNRNGLPDTWEATYGSTNAVADSDGDGMLNGEEYRAGTDPTNALSVLKMSSALSNAAVRLEFEAMSNKTYSVQYKALVESSNWLNFAEMVARRSNRVESLIDLPGTNRFYRVVTPAR